MKANEVFTGERFVPGIEDSELEIEHFQRYLSVLPYVEGKYVVDAACGEGYGSNILATKAEHVTGIDISIEAIERARDTYGSRKNLTFLCDSIATLPIEDSSVDVLISFETIEHVSEEIQKQFLQEIRRVLKDDGILIMSTPNKAIYSDLFDYHNEFHVKEFYQDEYIGFLKQEFEYVKLYNQFFEVVSVLTAHGAYSGMASLEQPGSYPDEAKYYIAFASNRELQVEDYSHVYMNTKVEYRDRIQRILQLQKEVEERNIHIKRLDEEIGNYRYVIEEKDNRLNGLCDTISMGSRLMKEKEASEALLKGDIARLEAELELIRQELNVQSDELCNTKKELDNTKNILDNTKNELEKKTVQVDNLQKQLDSSREENQKVQTIVHNKNGHIELLLEVEREYEREKKSRTYKMAMFFRKISTMLLPVNSKRRFFAKVLIKAIRHPFLMLKMTNPRRIKNCMTILKNEGVSSAMHHLKLVEEYERSRTVPVNNENIVIEEVAVEGKRFEDYDKLVFETVNHPDVSIVIPVYNQFDYTYHCLESILKNSGKCKYEVIIANDCSTDLTQRITEIVSGINVITSKKNLRFLLNCNNAAAQARGKYILFLNNDTQVQDNWLQPLITLIESDSKIGMVGSKLVYADGYLQEAGGILWKDASAWNYGHRQNPNDSEFNYVRETDYISGAAIMIRASLWKEIGGFDTRFVPAYCEDSDLAFEVRKHGYKVVYQPQSVVVHFEGVSNGTDLNSGQKKYQVDNQVKFVEKWREELEKNHFENGTNVFLARERSRDRKHVLVIDHYVPQYDKDAGSKTTWMYLKMLVKKGYKITFLGDNFYQHEPYTTELQQMGIFVLYGPKYAEGWKEWLEENIQYFDIFYLNRPHISIKYIDFIKERAHGKIIYYGHDLHFLRIQREYEISKDTKLLEESKKWLEQETYLMKQADMSYYPSVIEENAIHEIDPKIPVKAITAYVFEQFEKIAFDMKDRQGLLFVGGFGHGPNLDAVLWFLDKIYPEVYKRTKAPFYIVGSKAPEEITNIKTEGVIVKGFVSEEELQMLYKQCRIAVVPLRYGAGVKGKVVEALYYGIPIVTTSVGAEGINGIEEFTVVKDNENELIEEICTIYDNEKVLKDMSVRNQEYVKKHFSVDAVWNIVKEEFE